MRVGVIKDLNAQPLTFGLRHSNKNTIISDTPANLKDLLLEKKIDVALISSVECLRNSNQLSWCDKVGVCAYQKVRSILFLENKMEKTNIIYTDKGSRSSVALLRILLHLEKKNYTFSPEDPKAIIEKIKKNQGNHLIFGDNALFLEYSNEHFQTKDLCEWWFEKTKLPFIFAFWAYHQTVKIEDQIFLDSLQSGLEHIEEILDYETRLEKSIKNEYLKQNLHFFVNKQDKQGFDLFAQKCKAIDLI